MVEPQPSSNDAEAWDWQPGRHDTGRQPPASHGPLDQLSQAAASDPCVLLTPPDSGDWLSQEHRRLERYPVQASRPIAVRLLDDNGQPQGRWFLADILDISRGGLCLLLSGPMQFQAEQRLQLDLRNHPDFGQQRLECLVRWSHNTTISFCSLGVVFQEVLPRVPRLELERCGVRRDPNTEAWAQD
jgi:hypothetical protein